MHQMNISSTGVKLNSFKLLKSLLSSLIGIWLGNTMSIMYIQRYLKVFEFHQITKNLQHGYSSDIMIFINTPIADFFVSTCGVPPTRHALASFSFVEKKQCVFLMVSPEEPTAPLFSSLCVLSVSNVHYTCMMLVLLCINITMVYWGIYVTYLKTNKKNLQYSPVQHTSI